MTYPENLTVKEFDTLGSTNTYLKKNHKQFTHQFPILITARHQSKGKGRNNRTWFSTINSGLYSSFGFILKNSNHLNFVPLIAGISVIESLKKIKSIDLGLKWPNDIMYNGKKMAGILIENVIYEKKIICIVGIGINLNHSIEDFPAGLKETAISLKMITGEKTSIKKVNTLLAEFLFFWLDKLKKDNTETIINKTTQFSQFLLEKTIAFHQNNNIINGIFKGINSNGGLILAAPDGTRTIHFTGEILF